MLLRGLFTTGSYHLGLGVSSRSVQLQRGWHCNFSDSPSSRPQVRLIFFVRSDCVGHGLGLSRRGSPSPHQKPYLPCRRVPGYEHPKKTFNL